MTKDQLKQHAADFLKGLLAALGAAAVSYIVQRLGSIHFPSGADVVAQAASAVAVIKGFRT